MGTFWRAVHSGHWMPNAVLNRKEKIQTSWTPTIVPLSTYKDSALMRFNDSQVCRRGCK